MSLEREMQTYRTRLASLIAEHGEGKWVVIQGDKIAGVRDTGFEALGLGYGAFGLGEWLCKQILANEPILFFSRPLPLPPEKPGVYTIESIDHPGDYLSAESVREGRLVSLTYLPDFAAQFATIADAVKYIKEHHMGMSWRVAKIDDAD